MHATAMATWHSGSFTGRLGSSEISDVSASFSLRHDQRFAITSKGATIVLDDLLPVLNSFPATRRSYRRSHSANGSIALTSFDVKGAAAQPGSMEVLPARRICRRSPWLLPC